MNNLTNNKIQTPDSFENKTRENRQSKTKQEKRVDELYRYVESNFHIAPPSRTLSPIPKEELRYKKALTISPNTRNPHFDGYNPGQELPDGAEFDLLSGQSESFGTPCAEHMDAIFYIKMIQKSFLSDIFSPNFVHRNSKQQLASTFDRSLHLASQHQRQFIKFRRPWEGQSISEYFVRDVIEKGTGNCPEFAAATGFFTQKMAPFLPTSIVSIEKGDHVLNSISFGESAEKLYVDLWCDQIYPASLQPHLMKQYKGSRICKPDGEQNFLLLPRVCKLTGENSLRETPLFIAPPYEFFADATPDLLSETLKRPIEDESHTNAIARAFIRAIQKNNIEIVHVYLLNWDTIGPKISATLDPQKFSYLLSLGLKENDELILEWAMDQTMFLTLPIELMTKMINNCYELNCSLEWIIAILNKYTTNIINLPHLFASTICNLPPPLMLRLLDLPHIKKNITELHAYTMLLFALKYTTPEVVEALLKSYIGSKIPLSTLIRLSRDYTDPRVRQALEKAATEPLNW